MGYYGRLTILRSGEAAGCVLKNLSIDWNFLEGKVLELILKEK